MREYLRFFIDGEWVNPAEPRAEWGELREFPDNKAIAGYGG